MAVSSKWFAAAQRVVISVSRIDGLLSTVWTRQVENTLAVSALLTMAILPVLELVLRNIFGIGVPGATGYVQNLSLWVGFLGAMITSRERRHLNLAAGFLVVPRRAQGLATAFSAAISAVVASGLCWASLQFTLAETDSMVRIGGWLPTWVVIAVLPIAFAVITLRFVAGAGRLKEQAAAILAVAGAAAIGFLLGPYAPEIVWPAMAGLVAAALLGAPIFVLLGGATLVLFFADGVPVAAIPVATYQIVVSPFIPTIPLFALTGYILAEGGAGRRLVRLFRALFGWMPGGLAVVATLVCAFFSTFTGASGVTILALGGLLLPVLLKNGYPERFSVGLLTASGSIGLLFPPSIAVILYGVVAGVSISDLFMAGIIPGLIMVAAVCILGIGQGLRAKASRTRFDRREAAAALWDAKWVIGLPAVALAGIFGGLTTLIEAAAITVVYALIVECLVHRDIHVTRDLPRIFLKCLVLIGGIFVIIGIAMGLTNYLVDAEVPMKAVAWVESRIHSQILFLLALNVFLILAGSFMDIFSAIMVLVPLIVPISEVFGIHPLHLGMIFLVNLELGFLTPPVGMNLFLAAYRFERPLAEVCRSALPFLGILLLVVLLITYVPYLTIGVLGD